MSNYIRPKVNGATIFVTATLAHRERSTLVDHVNHLRSAVRATQAERPFGIDAWVVLPDHFHAVWSLPEGDRDFSTRMAAIKARFTRNIRRAGFRPPPPGPTAQGVVAGRVRNSLPWKDAGLKPGLRGNEQTIWQKRFWEHHIRDQSDWENHMTYCWHNPIKHGLVNDLRDWPYSSWHRDHV